MRYTARAMHVSLVFFALESDDVRAIVCPSRHVARLLFMVHSLELECAVPGAGNWWALLDDADDVSLATFLERLEARDVSLPPEVRLVIDMARIPDFDLTEKNQ